MKQTVKVCNPFVNVTAFENMRSIKVQRHFCWDVPKEKHEAYLAKKALERKRNESKSVDE